MRNSCSYIHDLYNLNLTYHKLSRLTSKYLLNWVFFNIDLISEAAGCALAGYENQIELNPQTKREPALSFFWL